MASLKKLENLIEANEKLAWYENKLILLKIRTENLWKKNYDSFEKYLDDRWGFKERRGRQLMKSAEFMQIAVKNYSENRHQKEELVPISEPVLPKSERQCRPLLEKLEHHGERLHVWDEVVKTREKITAELVQLKIDEYKASGKVVPDIEYEDEIIDIGKASVKKKKLETIKSRIEDTLKSELKIVPTVCESDVNEFMSQFEDASIDLLITDPPYSTDIEDIKGFAENWLEGALKKVKPTGYAFVFIGAYPEEVSAYLNICMPTQILAWEYKNTIGQNPKDRYKLNYQTILFYRGPDAGSLNIELTSEQWAVQSINAPDGRQGDRYHTWQKPIELADRLIRHTTNEGDIVVDPFCCTGTFLLAAARLNRKSWGGDNSKENLEIAIQRGCEYV